MGIVQISTQAWGVIWQTAPPTDRVLRVPVAGVAATLSTYSSFDGDDVPIPDAPATIYGDPGGAAELLDAFETDLYGGLPGYVEAGRYCIEVAGGPPILVEAVEGAAAGGGAGAVEAWAALTPYIGPGWQDNDDDAAFYIDRERVYFRGVLYYAGGVGANATQPIVALPVGYRPTSTGARLTMTTNATATSVATQNKRWSVFVTGGGTFVMQANPDFSASPNFGMPPVNTVLDLENLSYRAD